MNVSQVIRIVLKGIVNLKKLTTYIGIAQKMVFIMKAVIPIKPLAKPARRVSTVSSFIEKVYATLIY